MTLKFASFVTLLEDLEATQVRRATTEGRVTNPDHRIIKEWFTTHANDLPHTGPSALAILSCLLPERLPQRVYDLRETRLTKIFGRALGLGGARLKRLWAWKDCGGGVRDFAEHVASIMAEAETTADKRLTVDDIDTVLVQVAANSKFSGPKVRALCQSAGEAHEILGPIIRCLRSWEAKWFIRLILKDFRTVQIPDNVVLALFHFLLPEILRTQPDMEAAVEMLGNHKLRSWPPNPDVGSAKALKAVAATLFEPQMGVMLARQQYDKARSIKHCISLANKQIMSVERKYDGEYCQIHVTRTPESDDIQIFSKSGKDSTEDRLVLYDAIKSGLKLNGDHCKIQYRCVLEGELLIWNSAKRDIEPFHKIRRYVKHGGRFLGINKDSPQKANEHVMIMFYDILLLDGEVLANRPHEDRRRHLKDVVANIPGVCEIGWRKLIDFSRSAHGATRLREVFSTSIQQGWEGLVLKPQNDPYYSWSKPCRAIKLKKDYLQQLGDCADLCIVGARYDHRMPGCQEWNSFYLACLDNREAVRRFLAVPSFRIVGTVSAGTQCIPPTDLADLNRLGQGRKITYDGQTRLEIDLMAPCPPPVVLFDPPFVVECLGSGYDKSNNCSFWMLRFPRLTKIHYDRSITDTMTFAELQEAAQKPSHAEPDDEVVQHMIRRLIAADGKRPPPSNSTQSTSPGKTPRSATTASISPVAKRRPPLPPPFVRTDTSELNETELRHRRESSQTTTSTKTPSTVASRRSVGTFNVQPDVQVCLQSEPASTAKDGAVLQQDPAVIVPPRPWRSQLESHLLSFPSPTNRGKRKAVDAMDQGPSRQVRTTPYTLVQSPPAPRLEIDLTQPSPSAPPDPGTAAVTQVISSERRRSARRARGLVKVPPWCRGPVFVPAALPNALPQPDTPGFLSAALSARATSMHGSSDSPSMPRSKISRSPLSELSASSPQRTRPFAGIKEGPTETREAGREANAAPVNMLSKSAILSQNVSKPQANDATTESLPTPPGTEEAARRRAITKDLTSERTPPKRSLDAVLAVPHATAGIVSGATPDSTANMLPTLSGHIPPHKAPILVSKSLPPRRRVLDLLATSTSTFTYSHGTFLRSALAQPSKKHIILVDTANNAATAQEVWDLGLRAVKMLKNTVEGEDQGDVPEEKMRRTRLVFCDWRVIRYLTALDDAHDHRRHNHVGDGEDWNKYLCCVIELGGDVLDDKGNAAGRIVWR